MKNKAQTALNEIKENLYEVVSDYNWDEELELSYQSIKGDELNRLVNPIQHIIDNYSEWIPFTFDEEGKLNCLLPSIGEDILISNGKLVIIDLFDYNGHDYYLSSSNWGLEGLAWMRLPRPHTNFEKLAMDINNFFKDTDPYDYMDNIYDEELFIKDLVNDLKARDLNFITEYLERFISEGTPEEREEATKIMTELQKI